MPFRRMRPLAARNGKTIARVPASFAEAISFIFRALFNSLLVRWVALLWTPDVLKLRQDSKNVRTL